eukprot:3132809-Prymnesium_polylepis.1
MVRLIRLREVANETLSDPEMDFVLSSTHQRFGEEMLVAAGLGGQLIKYHPCKIYHAEQLYFAVTGTEGQLLPSTEREVVALRGLMMKIPLPPPEETPSPEADLPDRYV